MRLCGALQLAPLVHCISLFVLSSRPVSVMFICIMDVCGAYDRKQMIRRCARFSRANGMCWPARRGNRRLIRFCVGMNSGIIPALLSCVILHYSDYSGTKEKREKRKAKSKGLGSLGIWALSSALPCFWFSFSFFFSICSRKAFNDSNSDWLPSSVHFCHGII